MQKVHVKLMSAVGAVVLAGLSSQGFAQVIDGTRDASYGSPIAVQTVQTQFGDNESELNALYVNFDNTAGKVSFLFTGNLQDNYNKLVLFFDTTSGGQNTLRADNPDVAFNNLNRRYGPGTVGGVDLPGFTFDTGFEADRFVQFDRDSGAMYVNYAELNTNGGGSGSYLGSIPLSGAGADNQGSGTLSNGTLVGYNNANIAGVLGGTDPADQTAAALVETGLEVQFDITALGIDGDFKLLAFVTSGDHGFISNQFLPGLPAPQGNVGNSGTLDNDPGFAVVSGINLNNYAGDQFVTIPYTPVVSTWASATGGSWQDAGKWTGGVPNASGARVLLGNAISGAQTITLDAPVQVGRLTIDSAASYTIAGANTLTISGGSSVIVQTGSHTISAPVAFAGNTTVNVATSASLALTGSVDLVSRDLFKTGGGSLAIPATPMNSVTVNAGTLAVTGTGNTVLRGATIDSGATLDLGQSALLIDYDEGFSPIDRIKGYVNGQDGALLTSSVLAGGSPGSRAIGYIDSAANPALISYGADPVDPTTLVFRATLKGDSNLDLTVNFQDLLTLAQNYQVEPGTREWYHGDSNYDGNVNFADLLAVAQNYNGSLSATEAGAFSSDFAADWALAVAMTPEPASLSMLVASAVMLRRKRK